MFNNGIIMEYEVLHRPHLKKFLIRLAPGKYAYLGYDIKEGKLYIESTYTPPEFRGRGIARRLVLEAIKYAEENNLKIVSICSYAVRFFEKNPEYERILAE